MTGKKITALLISAAVVTASFASMVFSVSAAEPPKEITADKTAQWYSNSGETASYDLRIHGWSDWETAAYMGFTLPENFDVSSVGKAEIVLDTKSVNASSEAYLYTADYSGFNNGGQYAGAAAPLYTDTEIMSFTSASAVGEFKIDVTDYIRSISNIHNIAFRIDVKSQNSNNSWVIGSCNNGGAAPKLVFSSDDNVIKNGSFENGDEGWTISDKAHMRVTDGRLKAAGINYESRVSQMVEGMENGIYTLNAYITNDSIDGICYLYAKTKGHTMASTSVPVSENEIRITVPGIIVDDGKCDIGLYVNGSQTLTLDRLSFTESEESRVPFLKGGEISKITYVEDTGAKFYDSEGKEGDALQIMAENGFNLARIRLLNDPGKGHGDGTYYLPSGYMTKEDCFEQARRAKDKGMQIEFTFAYSDYWVDGEKQMVPHEWQEEITAAGLSGEALAQYLERKVYDYTKEIMNGLIEQGTCPEFVSVGNEVQVGILFNRQKANNGFYNNADYLARFLNAGAKAVRDTSPDTKIILHSDNGGKLSRRTTFVNAIKKVDFDVIGVSFYPYYNSDVSIDTVVSEFASFISQYDKDVIIMETGYNWTEHKPDGWDGQLQDSGYYQNIYGETQSGQRAFLTELYAKLKQTLGGRCIGDLYWDPVMVYDGGSGKIGWAIDEATDTTQGNVIPNSTIFDFEGKAVEGQKAMKYNTNAEDKVLVTGTVTEQGVPCTKQKVKVNINGRDYFVTTDKYGKYIAAIPYPADEKISVRADGFSGSYQKDAPYDGVMLHGIDFSKSGGVINSVNAAEENGGVRYTVDFATENKDAKLIAALYYNGVLSKCRIDERSGYFDVSDEGEYKVKAFLWTKDIQALCPMKDASVYVGRR